MKNWAHSLLSFFFGGSRSKDMDKEDALSSSSSLSLREIGKVWDGPHALKAYQAGNLFSNHTGPPIRICMRYLVPDDDKEEEKEKEESLLLAPSSRSTRRSKSVWYSWIDEKGSLHSFRKLRPIAKSSIDEMTVAEDDHMEHSFIGHAFIFVTKDIDNDDDESDDNQQTWDAKSLEDVTVIGAYRPHNLSTNAQVGTEDYPCHILEICPIQKPKFLRLTMACCPTPKQTSSTEFPLKACEGKCLEPLDTTSKEYIEEQICRWPVCVERGCFAGEKQLRQTFQNDLDYALSCIPGHARQALRDAKTRIYVNKTFQHGPKIRPVRAKGLCFHPDKRWLLPHGYSADKAGCVELYEIADYRKSRELWGRGGVLIHELSHAYHNKCLPDGYQNAEIQGCYQQAMDEGLYDCVKVHGPQGPTQRGYACENAMEYFAELSTAFLGGKKGNEEYNKWYPFNRSQIKEHDPRAYSLLCNIWKVRP